MNYKTDDKIKTVQSRVGDTQYDKRESIKNKWAVEEKEFLNGCGNVRVVFEKNKALISSDSYDNVYGDNPTHISSCNQISSALALYRTISMFECGLNSTYCDFYKMNWNIQLVHKKTGQYLGLGEWKGGFQIFTSASSSKDLPKNFIKDTEQLLTFLVSDKMPIGYDGTVAGSVA